MGFVSELEKESTMFCGMVACTGFYSKILTASYNYLHLVKIKIEGNEAGVLQTSVILLSGVLHTHVGVHSHS